MSLESNNNILKRFKAERMVETVQDINKSFQEDLWAVSLKDVQKVLVLSLNMGPEIDHYVLSEQDPGKKQNLPQNGNLMSKVLDRQEILPQEDCYRNPGVCQNLCLARQRGTPRPLES